MSDLEIQDVSKTYVRKKSADPLHALASTNATVASGEFVTVVGPSGCGKTTLLKIVQGLVAPSSGTVHIGDLKVTGPSTKVATVFQAAALFPWFSVLRNVAFGLECQGVKRKEATARAREQLERVGLSGFEKQYPNELSGGMQQRANLARAMAVSPEILLMDEPYAALDPQTRDEMQAELLAIWDQTRRTVLMITHQIDEAVFLSDRVLVMSPRPGRILADISVDLPRPRDLELKHSPEFQVYVDRIWHLLREAERPHVVRDDEGPQRGRSQDGLTA